MAYLGLQWWLHLQFMVGVVKGSSGFKEEKREKDGAGERSLGSRLLRILLVPEVHLHPQPIGELRVFFQLFW